MERAGRASGLRRPAETAPGSASPRTVSQWHHAERAGGRDAERVHRSPSVLGNMPDGRFPVAARANGVGGSFRCSRGDASAVDHLAAAACRRRAGHVPTELVSEYAWATGDTPSAPVAGEQRTPRFL